MTYAMGESLQLAIYSHLATDPAIEAIVGDAIYDSVPKSPPDLFVAIGPEKTTGISDGSGQGAIHRLRISVVTRRQGFTAAKAVAGRVSDALTGADLPMTRGRLVSLRFLRAEARRDEGEGVRRIDLWFRARLDDSDL